MSISTCVENYSLTENIKTAINDFNGMKFPEAISVVRRDRILWHLEAALIQAEEQTGEYKSGN
jgi:hypothetical protein